MPPSDSSKAAGEVEREVLRALCSANIDSAVWRRTMARLETYAWQEAEHKVVYEALRALRTSDAQARREQLPAQATRMGFPDVDWNDYLTDRGPANERLDQLVDTLE